MLIGAVAFASCSKFDLNYDEAESAKKAQETQDIKNNAEKIFGDIDPSQNWNSINSGSVSVNATGIENIVKVQILTESPLLNSDAKVLAEATTNGGSVTLKYDAPNIYKQLFAACINNKGVYQLQVFNVGDSKVTFTSTSANAVARRRATASEAPTFTSIKLKSPKKSYNTERTEAGESCTIGSETYTVWNNSGWSDLMWEPADGQTFDNGWKLDSETNKGHIYRDIDGFAAGEQANVEAFINSYTYKYNDENKKKKKNNLANVRNSEYFIQNKNYIYADGINPVTLIPIQAYTDEFKKNNIYYYYFKEEDVAGMDEETFVNYVKALPKFKAIKIERVESTEESKAGTFFRSKEFLLPFYKNTPVQGNNEASAIIPAGYKIGFLNRKEGGGVLNGCVYGDGRLNFEVNHIKGHYFSAMDKSIGGPMEGGMNWTDPRMAFFTANNKTYMCIEEGADCNFSDMVFEIGGATLVQETPQPEAEIYTMCFEDRPATADYDLNDVVLRCTRVNNTTLKLTLVATGANDEVVIHGAGNWAYNDKEVHEVFGYTGTERPFINTERGGTTKDVVSENVTVSEGVTIPDFLKTISIENKTTGKVVKIAQAGEPPFAVIVPGDFDYPLEHIAITNAYSKFVNWAQDMNVDKDWYIYPDEGKVYPNLFK